MTRSSRTTTVSSRSGDARRSSAASTCRARSGSGFNAIYVTQNIDINNLLLSTNEDPLVPIQAIQFGSNTADAFSETIRADLWVFPFLNVYALAGPGQANTTVRGDDSDRIRVVGRSDGDDLRLWIDRRHGDQAQLALGRRQLDLERLGEARGSGADPDPGYPLWTRDQTVPAPSGWRSGSER